MSDLLIGRQPIFDRHRNVVGYELLYRDSQVNRASFVDGHHATSTVLSRAFVEIGIDRLIGDKLAFVNLPDSMIRGDLELPALSQQVVLEVLEDVKITDDIIAALTELHERGFQLAMDDIVSIDDIQSVLHLVQIIKFDLVNVDRQQLPQQVASLRTLPIKILAEKVETEEEFQWCLSLGFDWFQGYFFCKPTIVSEKRIGSSALAIIQLLTKLSSADSSIDELEYLAKQDATLSYKILRIINSAAFGLKTNVTSLKQAINILGMRKLRSLLTFMLADHADDKPAELLHLAFLRGEMGERLLTLAGESAGGGFTVGLFSTLEALLGIPMPQILEQVPLAEEIKQALLTRSGRLGQLLCCIEAFEQGHWSDAKFLKLTPEQIRDCYWQAVEVARQLSAKDKE